MRCVVAIFLALVACQGTKKKEEPGTGTSTGTGTGTGSAKVLTSGGGDAVILPKIDRKPDVEALFKVWNQPDAYEAIHAAAHPKFQGSVKPSELKIFHEDFTSLMGKLLAVTSATSSRRQLPDGMIESLVFGEVMFEKGAAPYEVVFVENEGGTGLRLLNLKMEVPKQYKGEPDRAKARTVAKAAADAILSGNYDKLDEMSLPRIRGGRTNEDAKKMVALLGELGGGVRLEIVKDEACGETQHCIDYHAVGAKSGASISLKVSAPMGTWRVNDWHFEMDAKK